ncbi:hypothetical protein EST38_g8668 [Candolleomyces aberdarensis]|uniref:RGS domain-containing protein n=1 Tax=Candolleomyces aberdarensis TaxID=2316362 RepID=A0A4Q2DFC1_9AGAR|nr:hypothetical protein EST38_g8668 [Candolleomyces aberdarensis]
MASQSQATRPRTHDLTLTAILTFPLRMCNPPPAVAKVRSCGVTPLFKVRLEDVLNRKHLPPLGLKDFEEWLLFVEMSPENLYFTLWLREYRQRYNEWMAQSQLHRELDSGHEFQMNWHQHSPSLALFYARAKQTFFTPNSPYELNLPSSLLAVFHTSTESPHPDPAIFTDVSIETYRLLDESLRRFVSAQFNNVGNNRVLCGIVAGATFAIAGFLPPIILNFTRPDSRWMRLLAFPGLFLGLTIMIAALNGICMGVYIFGDLRQLRKFELARPQISKPQPITAPKRETESPSPSPPVHPSGLSHVAKSPSFADARVAHLLRPSSFSSRSGESIAESGERPAIEISPAFFDDSSYVDVENGIISTNFTFPAVPPALNSPNESEFTATASFIRPFDTHNIDPADIADDARLSLERLQPIEEFDFDSLPPRAPKAKSKHLSDQYERECCRDSLTLDPPSPFHATYPSHPYPAESHSPSGFVERAQSRCDIKKWRLQTESQDHIPHPAPGELPVNPYNHHIVHRSYRSFSTNSTLDSTDIKCL